MADLCPRCGAPDVEGDKCARCGVIASVYKASLEKMRRPPTLPAAAPTVDYSAAPPPSSPAATATAAWPLGGPSRGRKLTFHGSAGTLFGIHTVNILLTLVTLGFYRFWQGKNPPLHPQPDRVRGRPLRLSRHGQGAAARLRQGPPLRRSPDRCAELGRPADRGHTDPGRRPAPHVVPRHGLHSHRDRRSPAVPPEPHLVARDPLLVPRTDAGFCEALREGLAPERTDVEPLLSVLRDEPPRLPGLALLLRAAAPPLRRSRARPVRPLPPGPAAPV